MQPDTTAPQEPRAEVRDFAPVHAGGGIIAAVGLLLIAVLACVSGLPGASAGALYPFWLRMVFLLVPAPLAVLVLAVFLEAQFKIRVDGAALHRRSMFGALTRVPWADIVDYFADCGRSPAEMAKTGGSMVDVLPVASSAPRVAPFARFEPDYTIVHRSGDLVLDGCLADLEGLTHEVTLHAPSPAPTRWEEATWVTCPHCQRSLAVSVRLDHGASPLGEPSAPLPIVTCPACGRQMEELAAEIGHGYCEQFRGAAPAPDEQTPPE